jgi:hypothetical protein
VADGWKVIDVHEAWRVIDGLRWPHILISMLGGQALAIIPGHSGTVSAGTRVPIELLGPCAWERP